MPPEALDKHHYSLKGDVFAFGVMCYYLLAGRHPWRGKNKAELLRKY